LGDGSLLEQNERLEWVAAATPENEAAQGLQIYPGYNEPWQLQMVVAVEPTTFSSEGQIGSLAITIGSSLPNDDYLEFGLGAGVLPGVTDHQALFTGGYDGSTLFEPTPSFGQFPTAIGLRVTYDPNTRLVRMYSDRDTDASDGDWTLFQTYTIDGSTREGATSLNFGMGANDVFWFELLANSESSAIPAGAAWIDDFMLHRGATVVTEPGNSFRDNFDDDSLHADWGLEVRSGSPEWVEESNRLEFRVSSPVGEQEIAVFSDMIVTPHFNQGFQAQTEMHWLPAAMTFNGQVCGGDLTIENLAGNGDITLSLGAIFDTGQRMQVKAIDDSELLSADDMPEVLVFGDLPHIVGVRVVWTPETATLSCYFDTDGDRTTETWELLADYTLDGVDRGTSHVTNWGMAPEDQFRIGLKGYSYLTTVDAGEAYFENFTLTTDPLPTGYQAWAAAIGDEALRTQSADASGNGIPNLLQYLYGLHPLATDTDVQLRIQLEGETLVLVHGLNESASDFEITYQFKHTLDDPWSTTSIQDALSVETIESAGKTLRRIQLPKDAAATYFQLEIVPMP
jgi:hypothetical protein